jgi:hypothetical protein
MFKPAQCILAANRIERYPDGFDQRLVRAGLGSTHDVLDLGERFFYRREIRRVGRQK